MIYLINEGVLNGGVNNLPVSPKDKHQVFFRKWGGHSLKLNRSLLDEEEIMKIIHHQLLCTCKVR